MTDMRDLKASLKSKSSGLRILFAGGGTGGHLFPALALAEEIKRVSRVAQIFFAGTSRGIEGKLVPQKGYSLKKIWIRGFERDFNLKNAIIPIMFTVSCMQSLVFLLKFKPNAVVGTGGYVSGPVILMAVILGIPTLIQEQNSFPGFSTRFLARFVDRVHLSFEESRKYFIRQDNLKVSGNPTRNDLANISKEEALKKFGLRPGKLTLLVFGGSQGATSINQALLRILNKVMQIRELQIIWATGRADFARVSVESQKYKDRVFVKEFIDDMASAYAASDLVLCRSGATTVAELTRCGLAAILVPYPFAAAGHQEFNAKTLADRGAAVMILDRELQTPKFEKVLIDLLVNDLKRNEMQDRSLKLAKPEAANKIVEDLLGLVWVRYRI